MAEPWHLLLVDDEKALREAVAEQLTDQGFAVTQAADGQAALARLSEFAYDIVVTDLNMPGTNGAQLIPQLRSRWPALPIVAISGANFIDGRPITEIARERGADAAMIKPFRARELAAVLERLLAERAAKK